MAKIPLPLGAWPSELSAAAVAGDNLRLGRIEVFDGAVYWSEGRPAEGGRVAIMRIVRGGEPEELLSAPYSARSRVHEYGGGEFHVTAAGVFFVNDKDQQVYLRDDTGAIREITDAPGWRFADFSFDAKRNRLICVAEIHSACLAQPRNVLAAIDLAKPGAQAHSIFIDGADFYASPRVSADGTHLGWLQWNLPAMPWNAAEVYMSTLGDTGAPEFPRRTAGGVEYAAFQPEWAADGHMFFVADKTGQGALYRSKDGVTGCLVVDDDCMRSLWSFNQRSYALLDDARSVVASVDQGAAQLSVVDLHSGQQSNVATQLRSLEHIAADGDAVVCIGATDTQAGAIVRQSLAGRPHEVLRTSASFDLDAADISVGEPVRLTDLEREGVYGVYYPPKNARFTGCLLYTSPSPRD